jgi:hypothetical protein
MRPPSEDSAAALLVKAAHDLAAHGRCPFTAQDLCVHAWTLYPQRFGLRGYESRYPDFNTVRVALSGPKGLVERGYLRPAGDLLLRPWLPLPDPADAPPRVSPWPVPSPAGPLQELLKTDAAQKLAVGQRDQVTVKDCLAFYGLTRNCRGAAVTRAVQQVERLTGDRDTEEQRIAHAVHDWLRERFKRQLELLSSQKVGA